MIAESTILQLINLISKSTFPFTVITSILLFTSNNILNKLGLLRFQEENKLFISVAFLISISFQIATVIEKIFKYISKNIKKYLYKEKMIKYLSKLTKEEKNFLHLYIDEESQTQYLSIENGIVRGLELKGIIVRVSNIGDGLESTFAYNIQPYIFRYLLKHKEIID